MAFFRAGRDRAALGREDAGACQRRLSSFGLALRAAGGEPGDIVSLTIYAVDLAAYRTQAREIGQAWRHLCGREYPAMAAVEVSRLWDTDALVEIQGIAVVGAAG